MSIQIIKMPDIGEGIAQVEIVEWHVAVGDKVIEDEVLADVMTDKASVEIPSPVAGTVARLGGEVGDILAVGAELLAIEPAAVATVKSGAGVGHEPPTTEQAPSSQPARAPSQPPQPTKVSHQPLASPATATRVLASPSVRHRARQLGIDLTTLGFAADVVVSHSDLDKYLLQRSSASQPSRAMTASAPAAVFEEVDQDIRLGGLRRQIAAKMETSYRHIPHFSYVEEVDVTELEALRAQLNAASDESQPRLTVLPFIIRAMIRAIGHYPEVNSRFDEDEGLIQQFAAIHLGMATQTDKGLMVPVLHNAQQLDIWQCAEQVANVASLARRGRASRDQLSGSTITLTSLGALGGVVSTPIINHPEVAIVGVNRIVERLVPQNGVAVVRKTMNLSSSFDHRIIDGMQAAQFIQQIRRYLECPALLFVDGPA